MNSRHEAKKQNQSIIKAHIYEQLTGVHCEKPVCILFRWFEPNKKRDLDNICSAKKFIQDALVDIGILAGDGWRHIVGFTDEFYVDKENPRIEVIIREV